MNLLVAAVSYGGRARCWIQALLAHYNNAVAAPYVDTQKEEMMVVAVSYGDRVPGAPHPYGTTTTNGPLVGKIWLLAGKDDTVRSTQNIAVRS